MSIYDLSYDHWVIVETQIIKKYEIVVIPVVYGSYTLTKIINFCIMGSSVNSKTHISYIIRYYFYYNFVHAYN